MSIDRLRGTGWAKAVGFVAAAQALVLGGLVAWMVENVLPQFEYGLLLFPLLVFGTGLVVLAGFALALLFFGVLCTLRPTRVRVRRLASFQPIAFLPVGLYCATTQAFWAFVAWVAGALTVFAVDLAHGPHGPAELR